MMRYIQSVLHPEAYHGFGNAGPFFEGWYFKLINPSEEQRWCIIPGVYIAKNKSDSHAFIQVMNGVTGQSIYQSFEYNAFHTKPGKFEVHIADNLFTADQIRINIPNPELHVVGELSFEGITPWPVSLVSPGIMGWYGWVPGMECYHGVVSLNHRIQGELEINHERIEFSGGLGYIEKDWGKAFPKAWVWMQTNHFEQPDTSLTASTAIIPWGKRTFDGFIAGLWTGGHLYRFATYTGARLEAYALTDHEVSLVFADRLQRLEVTARRVQGGLLQAPTVTQMDRRIMETISAQVQVKLMRRKGEVWKSVFEGTGRHAGLEVTGRLNR